MLCIGEKIKKALTEANVAGATVAITDIDKIRAVFPFGRRVIEDASKPTADATLYRAASITKVVTGVLTMRLVEEGKLDLDIPVKKYLDWFLLKDRNASDRITLRHLMSHRSGLPAEYTPEGPLDEGELVPSLIAGLPSLDLAYPVGEGYLYSNWGIRLVSAVIESVMGERYSSLASRMILDPLGMRDSGFFLRPGVEYDLSMPHSRDASGAPVSDSYIKENYCRLATGGLYSNAPDLLKLIRMLMRGGVADSGERIISSESVREMRRENSRLASGDGYGLTLQIHRYDGIECFGHYGSAPPYSSALYADPESGFAAVALINTDKKDLRRDLVELAIREARNLK